MSTSSLSIKLHIDTKSKKVIFAEAGKDSVDFLFNLLTLPLGTITPMISKDKMVGSIGSLYDSVCGLNNTFFVPNNEVTHYSSYQTKEALLTPCISEATIQVPPFTIPTRAKIQKRFYGCSHYNKHLKVIYPTVYITQDSETHCIAQMVHNSLDICGQIMEMPIKIISCTPKPAGQGGYVKDALAFMVADDLAVKPLTTTDIVALIKDVSELEEKVVYLDKNKGVKLLKASLESKSVLTSVFLSDSEA